MDNNHEPIFTTAKRYALQVQFYGKTEVGRRRGVWTNGEAEAINEHFASVNNRVAAIEQQLNDLVDQRNVLLHQMGKMVNPD